LNESWSTEGLNMKRMLWIALLVGTIGFAGWSVGKAQTQGTVADFEISIEVPHGSHGTLRCIRGCVFHNGPPNVAPSMQTGWACEPGVGERCVVGVNGRGVIGQRGR
jgi:hypothetical protein